MTNQAKLHSKSEQEKQNKTERTIEVGEIGWQAGPTRFNLKLSEPITLNTKQMICAIVLVIMIFICVTAIAALYGGPYMAKREEISATASREVALEQSAKSTRISGASTDSSDISLTAHIEEYELSVFEFQKDAGAYIYFETTLKSSPYANRYLLKYTIDPASLGWSGISFEFKNSVNFSQYNEFAFKIQFIKNPSPLWLDVYSTTPGSKETQKTRLKIGDSQYGSLVSREQIVTIPVGAFTETDLSHVTNIIFTSDESLVNNGDEHEFSLSDIKFEGIPAE